MSVKPDSCEATYLVDAYSDIVRLKVNGKANYQNCGPLKSFFENQLEAGKEAFEMDLEECTGMDSTFLGMIAGVAIELKKRYERPNFKVLHVEGRNLELIENLGLHMILDIEEEEEEEQTGKTSQLVESMLNGSLASPDTILESHENLVKADPENLRKFQDVISFLKKQSSQETV